MRFLHGTSSFSRNSSQQMSIIFQSPRVVTTNSHQSSPSFLILHKKKKKKKKISDPIRSQRTFCPIFQASSALSPPPPPPWTNRYSNPSTFSIPSIFRRRFTCGCWICVCTLHRGPESRARVIRHNGRLNPEPFHQTPGVQSSLDQDRREG